MCTSEHLNSTAQVSVAHKHCIINHNEQTIIRLRSWKQSPLASPHTRINQEAALPLESKKGMRIFCNLRISDVAHC